jgi:hypothetical protein
MTPVKILMGLHPHAGWRSFKTDKDVSILKFREPALVVYVRPRMQYTGLTTPFGGRLLHRLGGIGYGSGGLVDRMSYRTKQFEIFLGQGGPTWDERIEQILHYIALDHSDTGQYVLEVHDMSGGEPRWDTEPGEELEEIDERANSFVIN